MSGPDPIGADLTRVRARRRLPPGAVCACCGERDAEVLRARESVLERHHIAGRVNEPDLTVVLCLNCHRRASTLVPNLGVDLQREQLPPSPERLVAMLRGSAAFLIQLAGALQARAKWLERVIAELDQNDSRWRDRQPPFDG
jgi:ribosomal protein L34E